MNDVIKIRVESDEVENKTQTYNGEDQDSQIWF